MKPIRPSVFVGTVVSETAEVEATRYANESRDSQNHDTGLLD
jgi:hypothetical protein